MITEGILLALLAGAAAWGGYSWALRRAMKDIRGLSIRQVNEMKEVNEKYNRLERALLMFCPEEVREKLGNFLDRK